MVGLLLIYVTAKITGFQKNSGSNLNKIAAYPIFLPHILHYNTFTSPTYLIDSERKAGHCYKTRVIDERGGTIEVPQDICLKLEMPKDEVTKPDFFNISTNLTDQDQGTLPPLDDGYLCASPIIRCDPDGLEFKKSALLTIPFSSSINSTDKLKIWCKTKTKGKLLFPYVRISF
jgi:hypothetical protein